MKMRRAEDGGVKAQPSKLAKNISAACLMICVYLSIWFPMTLHHYLIDRALANSEVVELELVLFKKWESSNPLRVPYAYKFEVAGVEYRGDQSLSEEALIVNHATGEVRSRVVYARHNPIYSRMEPVLVTGGVRWVSIFPKLWFVACGLAFIAWLIASWEQLLRLITRDPAHGSLRRQDLLLVTLNAFAALVFLLAPAFVFGAFLTYNDNYPLFSGYSQLAVSIAGILLVLLPVNVWLGMRLKKRKGLE